MIEANDFLTITSLIPDLKIISRSEYRVMAFSGRYRLLYHEWFETSLDVDDDVFRSETLELFKALELERPVYFVVNDKKRKTSISDDINEFLVVNFQPIFSHPTMKKVALISNEKLSIQGQAESTMEEVKNMAPPAVGAEFQFFIDVTQAVAWLEL